MKNKMNEYPTPKCAVCGNIMTPATECKNIATGEWDECTYKCDCCHKGSSLRLSIG